MIQKYVEQLAADIKDAAAGKAAPASKKNKRRFSEKDIDDHFAEVEAYLHGPTFKLSGIVGIDRAMLPSDDVISDDQADLLADAMVTLLNAHNFYPDFPQNNGLELPPRLRYKALRGVWDSEQVPVSAGEIHLEFCSYEEENCPFPGYCTSCSDFRQDDGFIPSIHNYCDAWCEKCAFTLKCSVFSLKPELDETQDDGGKTISERFQEIEDLLVNSFFPENEENSGADIVFGQEEAEGQEDLIRERRKMKQNPLAKSTLAYAEKANLLLQAIIKTCSREYTKWVGSEDAARIFDAFQTVCWYHILIYPKVLRALSGYYEIDKDEFIEEDMNGSAKVTLIAIDRSIEAFNVLQDLLEVNETEMVGCVGQLIDLGNDLEKYFPDARKFRRPGFDD
jgi:hypothetical protein